MNSVLSRNTTTDLLMLAVRQSNNGSALHPEETPLIIVCSTGVLLYLFAVLGDGMLIAAFVKDVRMRTTTNTLVISHLSAEFISSILGIVTHLSVLAVHGKLFVQSPWCVLSASTFHICMGGGFLSLVGISVDRYLAVVRKVHHKVTRTRVRNFLVAIWSLSLAYGIPWDVIFNGRLRWQYVEWLLVNCEPSYISDDLTEWSLADVPKQVFVLSGLGVPFVVVAYTSFRILRAALRNRRQIHAIGTTRHRLAEAYSRSAFTTVLIVIIYFLCLIPTFALAVVCEVEYLRCSTDLYFFAKVALCLRSACYPVILVARNKLCSKCVRRVFCRNRKASRHCFCTGSTQGVYENSAYRLPVSPPVERRRVDKSVFVVRHCTQSGHLKLAFVDLTEISKEVEHNTLQKPCSKRNTK